MCTPAAPTTAALTGNVTQEVWQPAHDERHPEAAGLSDVSTVPLSEAKARLSELIDSVDRTHDRVTITKNGREAAVIVSASDYASLEATLELLARAAVPR